MRIIDADRYWKELLATYDDPSMELEVLDSQPLVSAIPIPEGATNGDMIKDMFPTETFELSSGFVESQFKRARFTCDWWNAPYKGNLSEKLTGSESEE